MSSQCTVTIFTQVVALNHAKLESRALMETAVLGMTGEGTGNSHQPSRTQVPARGGCSPRRGVSCGADGGCN